MSNALEIGRATLARLTLANERRRVEAEPLRAEVAALLAAQPDLCSKEIQWRLSRSVTLRRVQQLIAEINATPSAFRNKGR